ncbi:transglutaminase family protein [Maricaulis sp.]|uniref:transglutaminase family protein n=1 Tax=Maricaulis sp. TaxID=1486257 RepID=UPI003A8EA596
MRLKICHNTRYDYREPVPYGLQQIRLRPVNTSTQTVHDWSVRIAGGREEVMFHDQHLNLVDLISVDPDAHFVSITCEGEVETRDTAGVLGPHNGPAPLWYFLRQTELTRPGAGVAALLAPLANDGREPLDKLHALSQLIAGAMPYQTAGTHAATTVEQSIAMGYGVCQDHAQVFISVARELGFPARYVSGYLMMNDRIDQEASHAWAEAHIEGLGWVGFDVSNCIAPDERYVRIATGLDYREAAPVSGVVFGGGTESMIVSLQVQQ